MTQAAPARTKIPTTGPKRARPAWRRARKAAAPARTAVVAIGTGRESTRGGGEVIELECGITVCPARSEGGRWRAVWYEAGQRQQREAPTEVKLVPKLKKVILGLQADAPNMRRPGADLIAHYLDPDRLPVQDRWSRKQGTQRRLCQRFDAPVIATVAADLDTPPAVQASLAAYGAPPSIAVEHRAAASACCVSPHSGPRACWAPRECAAGPAWRAVPDRVGPSPLDRWGRVARVGVVGCWFGGCGGAGVCRARCWQLARW